MVKSHDARNTIEASFRSRSKIYAQSILEEARKYSNYHRTLALQFQYTFCKYLKYFVLEMLKEDKREKSAFGMEKERLTLLVSF